MTLVSSFNPAFRPADSVAAHRYVHVIGAKVFTDDRPAEPDWPQHFLGMLGDEAWWAVDVPAGEDPSYGASLDLYTCLLYTSPSPRDRTRYRMPSSA